MTRRRTACVMAAVAGPLATVALVPQHGPAGARIVGLLAYLVAVSGAVLARTEWDRSGRTGYAWSIAGLLVVGAQLLLSVLADTVPGLDRPGLHVAAALVVALLLLGIVTASRHDLTLTHPVAVGLTGGGIVAAVSLALAYVDPHPGALVQALGASAALSYLGVAALVRTHEGIALWIRRRLVLTILLTAVVAIGQTLADSTVRNTVLTSVEVLAVLTLASVCGGLLTSSINATHAALTRLRETVERADLDARRDRQRLHEIDSTVAGIAAASRLLRDTPGLPRHRSRALEVMIGTEVDRLERIVQDAAPDSWSHLDLDHLVETLVVSHRARGRDVTATATGLHAMGSTDHVSQVVNTLLENAATHGGGAPVSVQVRQVDDTAQIVVSDTGPGVSASVRDSLFTWGTRGPGSSGQGIGLHAARQLMTDQGGRLQVADSDRGATFVVSLPLAAAHYPTAQAS